MSIGYWHLSTLLQTVLGVEPQSLVKGVCEVGGCGYKHETQAFTRLVGGVGLTCAWMQVVPTGPDSRLPVKANRLWDKQHSHPDILCQGLTALSR
jgi:hypothetical protein